MSAPVSFGFSKKVQKRTLTDSKLRDESTRDIKEEMDFVQALVGNEIQGTLKKPEPKKEWVIPLIKKNQWRADAKNENVHNKETSSKPTDAGAATVDPPAETILTPEEALERQALKELLDEAGEVEDPTNLGYEVPLLLQNRIPGGYEEDDNMDVSLRPEQSTLTDYNEYPIEQFGMAMLRGMGWKETEGIGRTNKSVIALQEPTLRPKGLGLGAERPQTNKDAVSAASVKGKEADLTLKIGAYAKINHGTSKGLYGQVQSFDEDNNRVMMKLALTSKIAAVSKFHMEVVSESEYKMKSKILNNEKFDEYKKIHDEKDALHRDSRSRNDEEFLDMSTSRQQLPRNTDEVGRQRETPTHTNGHNRDRSRSRSRHRHRRDDSSSRSKRNKKRKKEKKKRRRRSPSSGSSSSSSRRTSRHHKNKARRSRSR